MSTSYKTKNISPISLCLCHAQTSQRKPKSFNIKCLMWNPASDIFKYIFMLKLSKHLTQSIALCNGFFVHFLAIISNMVKEDKIFLIHVPKTCSSSFFFKVPFETSLSFLFKVYQAFQVSLWNLNIIGEQVIIENASNCCYNEQNFPS